VVVGILIAQQINNWNEKRKDQSEEIKILTALQNEFIGDGSQNLAGKEVH